MCELSLPLLSQGKDSGPPKPHRLRQSDKMEEEETRVSNPSTHVHVTCWSSSHHMPTMYTKLTKPLLPVHHFFCYDVHILLCMLRTPQGCGSVVLFAFFGHFCEVCLINHTFSLCISKQVCHTIHVYISVYPLACGWGVPVGQLVCL